MKRILAFVVALALFFPAVLPVSQADIVPPRPFIPKRDMDLPDENEGISSYVTAGSVVVACLVCSFGALYFIRKRNGQ